MPRSCQLLKSSISKKSIMAITGLMLCGFLVVHLTGNLLIIISGKAFNLYAHALVTNPLIVPAELGLATIFLIHIFLGITLARQNRAARKDRYYFSAPTGRGETFASATMPYTGLLILVFILFHLYHFRFGPLEYVFYDGVKVRDLYGLVLKLLAQPFYTIFYVLFMVPLGVHLSHGFSSAFQSLGLNHPRYTPLIKKIGIAYSIIISVGFAYLPLWVYFRGGR